ncbi:site-specific DNA-methyltransferase [Methylophaga nitratireducenticrescens]|uniref:site-specific DNA-methyltransferase n=1 Tax=Methylophaga nitratireducenticrescens TaxID=754476 RepID=UPI000CDC35D4|nr:site-specific DNA-methyltransferase [Methylophaga nitratireducenticrescens]AUZ83680.1 site-specific DNA-methyltransferase [Methylophaga nitratireducenticrescens]
MPTLDFKGKQFVYSHHLGVPFRELQVVPDKSLPAEGQKPSLDNNLIIHGDNLEALKALLPTHAGKVDCIFIDPPYNTGNEGWCYNDNVRSPLMKEWLKKSANPVDKEDLERHDKWLCMMWPRINLLHELLTENGSLWLTLDDNEVHHARKILDEVFGEDSCVGQLAWQKRTSRENRAPLSPSIDHLLLYTKGLPDTWKLKRNLIPAEVTDENETPGATGTIPFSAQGYRKNQVYKITTPTGLELDPPKGRCWGATEPEFKRLLAEDRIYWPKNGNGRPRVKPEEGEHKGLVPNTLWLSKEVGDTEGSKKHLMEIFADQDELSIHAPKPVDLIERIIDISTTNNSVILDSFAGSGTTAHAVLSANKKDNGNRRFILVECEEYADTLTAERVRRVINGYPFKGTQREELYRKNITWSTFEKKHQKVMEQITSIENLQGHEYEAIKKQIKDGVLTVTGERKVEEQAPGLGGSFTYCTLGEPIDIESLLIGNDMPSFEALARYVFYTATGQSLEKMGKPAADGFIGETDLFRVHLFYQPDKDWLRTNDAALNAERVAAIEKGNKGGKRAIVFAVAKFMSQKELTARRIEFCQLPYAVHRILGD